MTLKLDHTHRAETGREDSGRRGAQARAVAASLRHDIVSGALPAGAALGQEPLAARFGVSRMPVREALRLLVAEGFVTLEPNKSARVAPMSAADVAEIFDMRIAAECLALRCALPELTNAQLAQAAALQDATEAAPLSEFGALNAAFHQTLYAPCNRPRLLGHIETLARAADRYLRIAAGALDHRGPSDREHRRLLEACRARDEADAAAVLSAHISRARDELVDFLAAAPRQPDQGAAATAVRSGTTLRAGTALRS